MNPCQDILSEDKQLTDHKCTSNDDNTVDLVGGGNVEGWGDSYDDFKDGKYDPATNTISYDVVYAGMDFNVILTLN